MENAPVDIEDLIEHDVPLAPYTTFRIGGPASHFIQPQSLEQFASALDWAVTRDIPHFLLGGGANVLIHDRGFGGLIIHTGRLNAISIEGGAVTAECGVEVDGLVDRAGKRGLSGLEFAAGLPGTVGGALFMNARAYEGEFSHVVDSVKALLLRGRAVERRTLGRDELGFSYKESIFQGKEYYVYSVDFNLGPGDPGAIASRIEEIRSRRRDAGQFLFPNAGCIFKNRYDLGKPTGAIIDELGLKGVRFGDAEVYRRHGNFIVNRGSATADQVFRLIRLVESRIEERLGLRIEREINLIGPWDADDV
jgi:UDP-N-acetylmuramate dehydrogenase